MVKGERRIAKGERVTVEKGEKSSRERREE